MSTLPIDRDVGDILALADQAGLGIIRFGAPGPIVTANTMAHELLQRPAGRLVGRTPMEAFVDHRLETLVRDAAGGDAGVQELESARGTLTLVRAMPAAGGGAWVSLQDVTELARLRRVRSEFIDNMSHELRTPLANVRLLTEMLMDELAEADVPDRVRERVATIDVESGHLVQMINELLDLSRIEQTDAQVRTDAVRLGPVVNGSLERMQTFALRQGVSLEVSIPADLPEVRGDEERLDQLLMNLLHNAIKFSPQGSTVSVTAEDRIETVVLSVRDEGEGIPMRDQDRVFERFYKADRARQRGLGGTGLGLAIARHIAEAHGGRIWLESIEGEGSTFSFSVPVA